MSGKVDLATSIYFCGSSSLEKTSRILRHSEKILLSYTINSVLLYAISLGGVLETNSLERMFINSSLQLMLCIVLSGAPKENIVQNH